MEIGIEKKVKEVAKELYGIKITSRQVKSLILVVDAAIESTLEAIKFAVGFIEDAINKEKRRINELEERVKKLENK